MLQERCSAGSAGLWGQVESGWECWDSNAARLPWHSPCMAQLELVGWSWRAVMVGAAGRGSVTLLAGQITSPPVLCVPRDRRPVLPCSALSMCGRGPGRRWLYWAGCWWASNCKRACTASAFFPGAEQG